MQIFNISIFNISIRIIIFADYDANFYKKNVTFSKCDITLFIQNEKMKIKS